MLLNLFYLFLFYCFWIYTQRKLANDHAIDNEITDRLHSSSLFLRIHKYLINNPDTARLHAILTSFFIDLNVGIMLMISYYYDNYEPVYIYMIGIFLRQLCQFLNRLPPPKDIVWKDPGFPSILVTYDVTNDLFFSGHTYTAMAVGMSFWGNPCLFAQIYGVFFIIYEVFYVLVTRSHYFMDVYAAISTYFMVKYFFI